MPFPKFPVGPDTGTEFTDTERSSIKGMVSKAGKSRPRIGIFGDSIAGYMHTLSGTATSLVNNGNGTATITTAASLGIQAGDAMGVVGAGDTGYHVLNTPCLSVTGSGPYSYTYTLPSGSNPSTPDSGGTPAVVYPGRLFQAGFGAWAQALLKHDADFINLGIGGDTWARLLARFDRDVATASLTRLVICCGVNDVFASGLTLAQIQTSALAVFAKAQALGIGIDVMISPPQSSSRGSWTTGKRDIFKSWRNWLIQYCGANGIGVIDWWAATAGSTPMVSPSDANLNPSSGMLFDNVHPGAAGAMIGGKALAAYLRTFIPRTDRLTVNAADGNMLPNGVFSGSAGTNSTTGGTGTVADSWTISSTAGTPAVAASVVARTVANDGDAIGNNQRMAVTFGAANDTIRLAHASIHSQLTNGDTFRVAVSVKLSATGAQFVKGLYLYVLSQTATTGNLQMYDLAYNSSAGAALPDGFDAVFEVPAYVRTPQATHGAPSSVICYIEAVGAAAGTATIDVGRFTAVKDQ